MCSCRLLSKGAQALHVLRQSISFLEGFPIETYGAPVTCHAVWELGGRLRTVREFTLPAL